jgi:hypothetical protein
MVLMDREEFGIGKLQGVRHRIALACNGVQLAPRDFSLAAGNESYTMNHTRTCTEIVQTASGY